MEVLRYENSLKHILSDSRPIIFLAGPTVRGHQPHLTSWRFEAIDWFAQMGFKGILIVPEFTSKTESDKGKEWIPAWEFAGLCASDVNLFWIPRTKELIGLTTNHEHGYWLAKMPDKLVYGRPDDSYRNTYLDLMWNFDAVQDGRSYRQIYPTLSKTVTRAIEMSNSIDINRIRSKIPVPSPYGEFFMERTCKHV